MTTSPHAPSPEDPAAGLDPADAALLAGDVRPEQLRERTGPQPRQARDAVDWEAVVLSIRDRSRPARQRVERERAARQDRLDAARRRRVILATLDRLDRRFDRFAGYTVEHPQIAAWVLDTIRGGRDGLVIRGPVGTGKTGNAVAAYRAVVAGGIVPAVAVALPALLDGLRPGREPVEELRACEDARLLLLDDFAAERHTDWTGETMYRLIDARYARRLPTIITTNATGAQIREGLGERVASRLNGLGRIVTLDGPDRRTPASD